MSKEKIAQLLDDKRFKNYHYNTSEPIDWCSSTGSIALDIFMEGGLAPGITARKYSKKQ